jgi:hypothetical protein
MAQHGGETCVCRSTLQAETLSLLLGSEEADHLRFVLYSIKDPNHHRANLTTDAMDEIDVDWFTDCKSLFQHVNQSGLHVVTDKRLAIDLGGIRQQVWRKKGEAYGDPLITIVCLLELQQLSIGRRQIGCWLTP